MSDPFTDTGMSDPLDDDIPWADPAIRTGYEAALGQFILAYNEVDYRVSQVIRTDLIKHGQPDLAETASKGQFTQRLEVLAILASTSKNNHLGRIPLTRLRSLNADRNKLAHGHFDQNPYDGSYTVVLKEKTSDYPIERILALATELTQIAELLRTAEVLYDFKDLTAQDGGSGGCP
jgi:hypothetical protein